MGNKGGPTENISKQIHTWGDKEGVQQLLMCWCGACKQFVSCCFTPGQPVRLPRSEEGKTTAACVKHTYTYNNNKTNTGTRGRGGGGKRKLDPVNETQGWWRGKSCELQQLCPPPPPPPPKKKKKINKQQNKQNAEHLWAYVTERIRSSR